MLRYSTSSLVAALLVGVAAAPAGAAAADPVRVIVGLAGGADPAAVVGGAGPWRAVAGLPAITVDLPSDQVDATFTRWSTDTSVRYSVRDSTVHADAVADPSDIENNQNLRAFQVLGARTWTTGSSAITVAVVDTGVSPNPDLSADRIVAGYDFADGDADPADDDNHGTLVATTIGALGGNGRGATGVCDQCRIMPVRALRHTGADTKATGYSSDVAAGIVWAADHGAQIVNVSASTNVAVPLLKEAVDYATGKNVLVVASAGHDDESPGHTPTPYIGYPAAFDNAFAVGSATSFGGAPSYWSNVNTSTNRWIDVAAPDAMYVYGADQVNHLLRGTSAAAAVVSGVAALAYAMKPDLTAAEVRQRIVAAAAPAVGQPVYNPPLLDGARLMVGLGGTDTVAPVVTGDGVVADGRWCPANKCTYFATWATDDHAIARTEYFVNGVSIGVANPNSGKVWLVNPGGLNGPYPVTTRVYDYFGHTGQRTITVNFDTRPPAGKIDSPVAGLRVHSGAIKVVFSSPEPDHIQEVGINGVVATHVAGSTTWTATVTPRAGGKLEVSARDLAGNYSRLTRTVTVVP